MKNWVKYIGHALPVSTCRKTFACRKKKKYWLVLRLAATLLLGYKLWADIFLVQCASLVVVPLHDWLFFGSLFFIMKEIKEYSTIFSIPQTTTISMLLSCQTSLPPMIVYCNREGSKWSASGFYMEKILQGSLEQSHALISQPYFEGMPR